MQEERLYTSWLQWAAAGKPLRGGRHTLKILNPGQLNTREGPDFLHALFEWDGVRMSGSVEIHATEQDWYRHGHHLDNRYGDVLLHIVGPGSTVRGVGHQTSRRRIPSFILPVSVEAPPSACRPREIPVSLKAIAGRRLALRCRALRKALAESTPLSLFYRELWRSLGYGGNAAAFELLARRLPWPYIQKQRHRPQRISALLQEALLHGPPLRRGGLRPSAQPESALELMILWFRYYGLPDLYKQLSVCLRQRPPISLLIRQLYRLFNPRPGVPARYGRARILELTGNLLFPLELIYARQSGSEGYYAYLQSSYFNLPQPQPYALFKRAAFRPYLPVRKFFQAQALLHTHRLYCLPGHCAACPLEHHTPIPAS